MTNTWMWKPIRGHNSKSYGLFAPILLPHLLFSGTKCSISFMEVGPENILSIKQNVKSRN